MPRVPNMAQFNALMARVVELEAGSTPPSPIDQCLDHDHHVDPDWTTSDINDAMWTLMDEKKGGDIHFDGHGEGIPVTDTLIRAPGLNLTVAGYLNPWSRSRTTFLKAHDGPGWDFVDGGKYDNDFGSGRNAWWGGKVAGLQVDCLGRPGPAFRMLGGNCSWMQDISAIGSPEYGWVTEDAAGRNYDGQYSAGINFFFKHYRKKGIWAQRGSPDHLFMHGWVYGTGLAGTTGVQLDTGGGGTSSKANNFTFIDVHSQFAEKNWDIDSEEVLVIGGSTENKSGAGLISNDAHAIIVGSHSRWLQYVGHSIANKSSWKTVVDVEDGAARFGFVHNTGLNEGDIDHLSAADQEHFVIPVN